MVEMDGYARGNWNVGIGGVWQEALRVEWGMSQRVRNLSMKLRKEKLFGAWRGKPLRTDCSLRELCTS